jgi:monofunctional biosynthetic peptidoglycan transglycosylase
MLSRRDRYRTLRSEPLLRRSARRAWLVARALALLLLADLCYVAGMAPDWELWAEGPVFESAFIRSYRHERAQRDWPLLRWKPLPLEAMSVEVIRAVVVAEDGRFWEHDGFDRSAFEKAMEHNLSRRRVVYGGSTISQQTVKNLVFTPTRNPIRKWHELLLTFDMERHLEKRRILEIYVNVAEFGLGIYGVQAAAHEYFGVSAARLSARQAAELAAALPAPRDHNPRTRTRSFERRVEKLLRQLRESG